MSGTFTQTRKRSRGFSAGIFYDQTGQLHDQEPYVPQPSQTTTSFRSGAGKGQLTPQTALDFYKESKNRYERPTDYGHPFSTSRTFVLPSHPEVVLPKKAMYPLSYYRGPLGIFNLSMPGFPSITNKDSYYGALAIKNTRPFAPQFALANTVGELVREGIPLLAGRSVVDDIGHSKPVKTAGGEWLNVTFGWQPIAAAIRDLAGAVVNLRPNMEQYFRDSDRVVRRGTDFGTNYSTVNLTADIAMNQFFMASSNTATEFQMSGSTRTRVANIAEHYWFNGAYTYYAGKTGKDPISDMAYYSRLANQLLGTEITPEVIYNLTPWTWLLDWHYNFGDIISNMTYLRPENQVLRYGYLMCQTVEDDIRTVTGASCNGVPMPTYTTTTRRVSKRRIRANPYGFSANPNSFTSYQWSILAALGMTAGSNKLR